MRNCVTFRKLPEELPKLTREDPAAFAPPPAFGPFRVLHQIGVGALGPVYRTYEPIKDRLVAVKAFRLDITPEQSRELADALGRAAEAGLFHPSIVEPLAAGVEGTVAYRAEEYVAGESLDVAIRHHAPAPLEKVLPLLTQLAGAIDFARAAGVGHGALHLRDVFVTPDEARASGFGVVEALERVGLRAPVRRPYSAPERIAGAEWGTPADVFSLAAIGFELFTGRRPAGTGDQIGPLPDEGLGADPTAVWNVLARAMDENPSQRYGTALAFASALERASHVRASAAPRPPEGTRADAAPAAADWERTPAPVVAPAPVPFGVPTTGEPEIPEPPIPARDSLRVVEPDLPRAPEPAPIDLSDITRTDVPPAAAADLPPPIIPDALPPDFSRPMVVEDHDDIAAERDEDDAFEALLRDERPPDGPVIFGEDDPLLLDAAGTAARESRRGLDERAAIESEARAEGEDAAAFAGGAREEPRPSGWALAAVLVFGLMIGAAAGWFVWGRQPAAPTGAQAETGTNVTSPQPPAAAAAEPVAEPTPAGSARGTEPATPPREPPSAVSEPAAEPVAPSRPAPRTSGDIVVESTPTRAGVVVNGEWKGRTPLTLREQKFGRYVVRVTQPGYTPAQQAFSLTAEDAERRIAVTLRRTAPAQRAQPAPEPAPSTKGGRYTGSIYVDSRPRGATVYLDRRAVGTTPLRLPDVPVGSHVVRLELADHSAWSTSTRVTAGEESRVTGSLERIR